MDEDVGKVSSTVPVMVSRALERFLEHIMIESAGVTSSKDAKTLTSQHILEVVSKENRLHFLREAALKSCNSVNQSPHEGNCSNHSGSTNSKKDKTNEMSKHSDENDSDLDA